MKITGEVKIIEMDVRTGKISVSKHKNTIPLTGQEAIARRLINEGSKPNEGIITYGAVGTDSTTASINDTKLGNEIFRKQIASTKREGNKVYIRTFLTTTEGNGELKEFGLFGEDATTTKDSGTLFERVNINRTKTSNKTLLIESVLTIEGE